MVKHWVVLLLLFLPACAHCPHPADAAPSSVHAYRCALDNRPRMLVIDFGNGLYAAWDTGGCFLYKVWKGDVLLTGTVYDTRHGPRPSARGTILLASPAAAKPVLTTQPSPSSTIESLLTPPLLQPAEWLGHEIDGQSIRLSYQSGISNTTITLTPSDSGFPLNATIRVSR